MKIVVTALLIAGALVVSAFAFVYAGIFNVAADVPHSAFAYAILETIRSRSIATRAKDIPLPPLDDATLIATGAEHYAAMCSGCHLAPDKKDSEMRAGLYPKPPDLTKRIRASPAEAFWVVKHGIKLSGMPAWGVTHDDSSIWGLVAFLQKLPGLTPVQYHELIRSGKAHHQRTHGEHEHAGSIKSQDTDHASKGRQQDHEQ